ncbi:MAG: ABC transporter ATP-binding protein [Chitinivibrionales bacterium]
MIEIRDLSFAYGESEILKGVSLSLSDRDKLSIIGSNGAGKSTLIRCISGLLHDYLGSIHINGKEVRDYKPKDLALLCAYVPQAKTETPPYSVYEYVMMGRFPYMGFMAIPDQEDRRAVNRALELTETPDLRDRRLGSLSGGELQRVFIAAAVAQETEILLLDEPATFLDPLHSEHISRTIERIHKNLGTTVVTVTHDVNTAVYGYTHILALKNGKTVYSGTTEEFLGMAPDILKTIYGIEFSKAFFPDSDEGLFSVLRSGECV